MPSFCVSCGTRVDGAFCSNCGQRIQGAEPTERVVQPFAQRVPEAPSPAAVEKKGGLAKPLLITFGILLLLITIAFAGAAYSVYWLKNRAMAKLSTYTGGVVGRRAETRGGGHDCQLLSRDDLAQAIGVPIEKSVDINEGSDTGCAYFTNSEAFLQLRNIAAEQARRDSEIAAKDKSLDKTDNPLALLKHTKEMEGIVKTLTLSQADKEGRVFAFTVDRAFGRENWPALRTTLSVVPGFDEVTGVGDRAMVGSFGHAIYVLKGNSMIRLDLTSVPDARVRGAEIARKIAARL